MRNIDMYIDVYWYILICDKHSFSGGQSMRMYPGRRSDNNSKSQFPTLMDDNSD